MTKKLPGLMEADDFIKVYGGLIKEKKNFEITAHFVDYFWNEYLFGRGWFDPYGWYPTEEDLLDCVGEYMDHLNKKIEEVLPETNEIFNAEEKKILKSKINWGTDKEAAEKVNMTERTFQRVLEQIRKDFNKKQNTDFKRTKEFISHLGKNRII